MPQTYAVSGTKDIRPLSVPSYFPVGNMITSQHFCRTDSKLLPVSLCRPGEAGNKCRYTRKNASWRTQPITLISRPFRQCIGATFACYHTLVYITYSGYTASTREHHQLLSCFTEEFYCDNIYIQPFYVRCDRASVRLLSDGGDAYYAANTSTSFFYVLYHRVRSALLLVLPYTLPETSARETQTGMARITLFLVYFVVAAGNRGASPLKQHQHQDVQVRLPQFQELL